MLYHQGKGGITDITARSCESTRVHACRNPRYPEGDNSETTGGTKLSNYAQQHVSFGTLSCFFWDKSIVCSIA